MIFSLWLYLFVVIGLFYMEHPYPTVSILIKPDSGVLFDRLLSFGLDVISF